MEHQQTVDNTSREQLVKLHGELAQAWGIDFQRARLLLGLLCNGDWHTTSDLIAASSISHWNITHLLQQLDPWLEQKEQRVRIKPAYHATVAAVFDCARVSQASFLAPYEIAAKAGERAAQAEALVASTRQLVQQFPGERNKHLDHVAATPLTCVKRALFLVGNYALERASVLFLGET